MLVLYIFGFDISWIFRGFPISKKVLDSQASETRDKLQVLAFKIKFDNWNKLRHRPLQSMKNYIITSLHSNRFT